MQVAQCTDPITYHGEGPVWSEAWGGLRWVDMLAGDILSLRADGEVSRRNVGTIAAALRPRCDGGAVIGTERGFLLEDAQGNPIETIAAFQDGDLRMNDGACDPDGRFYCGSMAYDQRTGAGTLYRFDPDRSVKPVLTGVTISNGLDWSPDGTRAYYADTPTNSIVVFDYAREAGLMDQRVFVSLADHELPDGLTVDAEGGVWVAMNGSGQVRRYTSEGSLDEIVEVPARQVTACTLGGPNLTDLYITTSRENLAPEDDPLAGALFCARVTVPGQPVRAFAG